MKNTVIVSYYFKPDKSIGSKRWTSISEHFQNKSKLILLSATPNVTDSNFSKSDYISSSYAKVLDKSPENILEKIKYRMAVLKQKISVKGSLYDRGVNCADQLFLKMSSLVENDDVVNVIITGAPFSWLYSGALLKIKYPHINLICDLRDPWTWGQGYGFSQLSEKRRSHEEMMESTVLANADKITVPSEAMLKHLLSAYEKFSDKLTYIPHGFSKDKIDEVTQNVTLEEKTKLTFIYAGTLYQGVEQDYIAFVKALKQQNIPFVFNIYSRSVAPTLLCQFEEVNFKGFVPTEVMFEEIIKSNFYLMAYPDKYKNFISAKFYEIIYMKKKIFYIGPEGDISKLITTFGLGEVFLNSNFNDLENKVKFVNEEESTAFNIDKYNFASIAAQVKRLLV